MNFKKFYFFIFACIVIVLSISGASKTSSKIGSEERNIGSIQILQNRTIDQLDNICDDLDSLFGQTAGVHADSISKTAASVQRAWVDSLWRLSYIDGNPIIDSVSGLEYVEGNPVCDSLQGVENIAGAPYIGGLVTMDSISALEAIEGNPYIDSASFTHLSGGDTAYTRALEATTGTIQGVLSDTIAATVLISADTAYSRAVEMTTGTIQGILGDTAALSVLVSADTSYARAMEMTTGTIQGILSDTVATTALMSSDTFYTRAAEIQRATVDTATATVFLDANGAHYLSVTEKYSITACGDFDTSADNTTEQGIVVDSIPAYSRLMDAWVICTEQVLDTGDAPAIMALEIGTSDGGAEAVATGDIDSTDEIGAMSIDEAYDIVPAVTKQAIFLNATPDSVWLNIIQGSWDVYLQYNDNESY